jgi:hypothetical protein
MRITLSELKSIIKEELELMKETHVKHGNDALRQLWHQGKKLPMPLGDMTRDERDRHTRKPGRLGDKAFKILQAIAAAGRQGITQRDAMAGIIAPGEMQTGYTYFYQNPTGHGWEASLVLRGLIQAVGGKGGSTLWALTKDGEEMVSTGHVTRQKGPYSVVIGGELKHFPAGEREPIGSYSRFPWPRNNN